MLTLINSTIAYNAPARGLAPYGDATDTPKVTLVNSIIARNGNGMSHFDCYDTAGFTYVGVNIADDPSCGQNAGMVVLDPLLELPANNGGPTLTVGAGSDLTQTGFSVMTPEFAAPEQVRGTSVSTATDVYSLGVLLYMLLARERPYDVRGKSPAEIERIVCVDVPTKPSLRAPAPIARHLRGDLDLIVMTALQKDEQRRYQSPAALAHDVQQFRQGRGILARPDSARYRLGKFIRRNRTAVFFTVATAAALVGATVFSVVQMQEARAQRQESIRAATRAKAMSELQTVLGGDARDPDGRPLPPAGRIAMAEGVIVRRFKADPSLVAGLLVDLSGGTSRRETCVHSASCSAARARSRWKRRR
jgi:hypothetical protein